MKILNAEEVAAKKIESFPYKGKPLEVKRVSIKWLSQAGPDESSPDYGLRFFTVGPGGTIPIHSHFYVQTMYMLTGNLIVYAHDPKTDDKVMERRIGVNDFVFVPSMEPHSMVNPSDTKEATFLCCIANLYEDEA
jgi:quercetin dioxygenase-like cupin family protein